MGGCGRILQLSICCLLRWCFIKDEQNCLSRSQDAQIEKEKQVYNVTGGCTALTVVYLPGKLYVANAGDSRCVRLSSVPSMKGSVEQWNENRINLFLLIASPSLRQCVTHEHYFSNFPVSAGLSLLEAMRSSPCQQSSHLNQSDSDFSSWWENSVWRLFRNVTWTLTNTAYAVRFSHTKSCWSIWNYTLCTHRQQLENLARELGFNLVDQRNDCWPQFPAVCSHDKQHNQQDISSPSISYKAVQRLSKRVSWQLLAVIDLFIVGGSKHWLISALLRFLFISWMSVSKMLRSKRWIYSRKPWKAESFPFLHILPVQISVYSIHRHGRHYWPIFSLS